MKQKRIRSASKRKLAFHVAQIEIFIGVLILLSAGIGTVSATTITVNPSESIQDAINSLPSEGGVVELAPGTWTINSIIRIDKSNVILRGAGKNETIIEQTNNIKILLVRGPNAIDPTPWVDPDPDPPPNPNYIVNITIENLSLIGTKGSDQCGIKVQEGWKVNIDNVYIEKVRYGLLFDYSYDIGVTNSECNDTGLSGIFMFSCHHGTVANNIVRNGGRFGIEYNSGNTYITAENNTVSGFSILGGIYIYGGSKHNIIKNNTCYSNRYGLYHHTGGGNNIVDGCIFRDNSKAGVYILGSYYTKSLTLKNNLIYRNGEGGIISAFDSNLQEHLTVAIVSNTIYSNNGDGIYNKIPDSTFDTKNNIIVNNSGYGINREAGTIISSYNDVWNNLVDYNGCSAGTGDISSDPLFAYPESEDFHLKSTGGRWAESEWVYIDTESSPCIDAGDLSSDYSNEPDYPNGHINMGAYGNTEEASKPPGTNIYNLSGYVRYINGTGIYNALVTNNVTSAEDYTDASGYYVLTGLVNGTYNATASKAGFYSNFTIVTIDGADVENADITLTELPPDNTPPVISDVQVSSITSNSATITWTTDELANSLVKYGTSPDSYTKSKSNSSYVPSHSIVITGLTANTTYYYVVNSTDQSGNSAQSNEYNFKTSTNEYIWLEAEDADTITPDFDIANDMSASNGKYLGVPEGAGWNPRKGEASYNISIDSLDNYVIWGRKIAATGGDNTFFVQIDDGTEYLWTIALSENWQWDAVNHWGIGEEFNPKIDPVVFNLSAGDHLLKIKQREDGTKLDKLLITNNMSYVPADTGDTTPPTTTYILTPTPNEAGWNNVTPVVVTFFRSDTGSSGISYTNYSKTSETGLWTTVNVTTAMGPDAGNVTDISEGRFNVTVSDGGTTEIWYYSVDNNSNVETTKNITVRIDTVPPVIHSNVTATDITGSSATITWTTDENSDSKVYYGETESLGTWKNKTESVTSHFIALTGLAANTTYYYQIYSADEAGNTGNSSINTFKTASAPKEGDVIIWDTNKKYTQKHPFSTAFADKDSWTQMPYGMTEYTWVGDPMIENEHYYLFLFSNTDDSPCLAAKLSGDKYCDDNEIYKVYDTGARDFGHGTLYTKILKNTPEEAIVEHAAIGDYGSNPDIPIITTYRIPQKAWMEVTPIDRVNQQGMHDKSRLAAFVFQDVDKDIILDAKKHGNFAEDVYPSEGCIGEINFKRWHNAREDFMWFLTFPPGTETNSLTYQGIHYPDGYWEEGTTGTPSVGANYAYLGEKVVIGVLRFENNWEREDVNQYLNTGETYTSSFTAPYAGKWRVFGVMSDGDYYITNYSSEVIVNAGDHFTFTSPVSGTLDYLVMYMFDRTENTAENTTTIMDVYRETIGGDVTLPVISNVHASAVTANSATITWNTNEACNSLVKYSTSSGIYTESVSDSTYVTSHSISLSGLTPNATYFFVVNSTDPYGNPNQSSEYSFTTAAPDITPPNITNVQATSITTNSATIAWDTDEEADTKVTYDTNPSNLGTFWKNNSVLTKSHSILLSGLDDNTTYFFMVYSTDVAGNTANSIIYNFTTSPVLPGNATVIIQAPNDVNDNRLREASPDTVLGSDTFIDVSRIGGVGNYRGVIGFNLSQLNSTDQIKSAKLSLFWYYESRNKSTTVEIYRPVDWNENYVNWNNRTNGVAWNNPGGDWYDKNNVAQGNMPYASLAFPIGAPDNAYHEFDVTELVQGYVNGTYSSAGFFIKANEVSDDYIAFRSSDWGDASERPKLVISYSWGSSSEDTAPPIVTNPSATPDIIPDDTDNDPGWGENSTLNVTVTDDSGINVTINLSQIGGSSVQPMTNIEGDIWSVTTNASAGTAGWNGTAYDPYHLQVNATDIHGNSNMSVSIELMVMKNGDVTGDGIVDDGDGIRLMNHDYYPEDPRYGILSDTVADVTGEGDVDGGDGIRLMNHDYYPEDPHYMLK